MTTAYSLQSLKDFIEAFGKRHTTVMYTIASNKGTFTLDLKDIQALIEEIEGEEQEQ